MEVKNYIHGIVEIRNNVTQILHTNPPFILIEYNFTYKTKNMGFQKLFYATV